MTNIARQGFSAAVAVLAVAVFVGCGCETTDDVAPERDRDAGGEVDVYEEDTSDVEQEVDTGPTGPPEIEVTPLQISFEGVELDDTATETVWVWNRGEGPLQLEELQFRDFPDGAAEQFTTAGEDLDEEFPIEIAPETAINFELEYTPELYGSTSGELAVFSDDEEQPEVTLRIETISAYPELEAADRITFGTVDPEDAPITEIVSVFNRGLATLEIESVELAADSAHPEVFSVQLDGSDSLERNSFAYVEATFDPDDDDSKRADVIVETNDPVTPEHVIELTGNRPTPCAQVPAGLVFDDMSQGDERTDAVTVFNCSMTHDLELDAIDITDDAGGVFELVDPPEETVELSPTDTFDIDVRALMAYEQESVGELSMETDDPDAESIDVELRAIPPEE